MGATGGWKPVDMGTLYIRTVSGGKPTGHATGRLQEAKPQQCAIQAPLSRGLDCDPPAPGGLIFL